MTTMRIGQLAAASGRSAHTLRYYESIGLLPFVGRDAGGRRVYHPRHLSWLAFLDRLRTSGMALADMLAYTALVTRGRRTIPARVTLLQAHLAVIDKRMRALERSRSVVQAKLAFYRDWEATGRRPEDQWTQSLDLPDLGEHE